MASRGLREAVAAGAVVALVFGVLTIWSSIWPPMVVIESGSMMHQEGCLDPLDRDRDGDRQCTPYGRFGTMDPGDIMLVKRVEDARHVETLLDRGEPRYGYSGDVILFYPNNNTAGIPIIHRALTWVEVAGTGPGRTYVVDWTNDERLHFGPEGIYLPEFGIDERYGYPRDSSFKPTRSGFITRGDNPLTNPASDQALKISPLVEPGWIQATAHGEIPWFGLMKLALGADINQPFPPISWVRVGNAFAPADLWVMLGVVIGVLLAIPIAIDVWRALQERRRDREAEERRERVERERAAATAEGAAENERANATRRGRTRRG